MHQCYSVDNDEITESVIESKSAPSAFVSPSAGVRRYTVSSKASNHTDQEDSSGLQPNSLFNYQSHHQLSDLDRRAGLRWVGIEASELLLPGQFTVSPRMLRFLGSILGNIPRYRAYIEDDGRLDVFAISLQLPLAVLQKLLPTRHSLSLLQQTTVLQIPNFLLLPQALSVVATALCSSEQLTKTLLDQLHVEKILSIVLVKMLELWSFGTSNSGSTTHEIRPSDPAAPNELLFCPSMTFRVDAISSLSCVLALESYSQLIQRIGVCSRLFLSCDLQLIATLLACATCACMPNLESDSTKVPLHSNFHPRNSSFLSLRLTSPLDIVAQCFSCLRAATKFTPAIAALLQSPYGNYEFSVDEDLQNRLARVIRSKREPFFLNPFAVWKSSCSILAQDFNQFMFSPFKLALRWLKLIHYCGSRSHCNFQWYSGLRSPAQLTQVCSEPEIFDALRNDAACVQSITFSCFEILSLVSSTSEGRDCIFADEIAIKLAMDICDQNPEETSLRVFILTIQHNFSLQSTNQSLELLLRDYALEFMRVSIVMRNVEGLQVSLQIVANIVQRIGLIGKTSHVSLPVFNHFWGHFQSSLCSHIVAAALHPVPAVMRSALTIILNACTPGNPPKIRRLLASSGIFNILQHILLHPQKNLKLLALGTVASVVDGDTVESLRWSDVCATIIDAGNLFQDKGQDAIDAHMRFMTMTCIHNVTISQHYQRTHTYH